MISKGSKRRKSRRLRKDGKKKSFITKISKVAFTPDVTMDKSSKKLRKKLLSP